MSQKQNVKREAKKVRKEIKSIVRKADQTKVKSKAQRSKKRAADARAAMGEVYSDLKRGNPPQQALGRLFQRMFTNRDAARLAWMLTVSDPWGDHVWSIPPILAPGVPLSQPRMYRISLCGYAVANSSGRVYIGLNADGWLPFPGKLAATVAEPSYSYLGNSVANGGARGYPLHYTTQAYIGTSVANSTGTSYPGPAITQSAGTNGLVFMQLPDNFINVQLNNSPASGNAYQRATCVSAGLRVRPTAPASGALVPQGTLLMVQQCLGDTVQTNPAAASGPALIGGVDAYAYVRGQAVASGVTALTSDQVNLKEMDIMEWPHVSGERSWLSAAAIPNQSCSLGAWVPLQTGTSAVGYPQVACLGQGMLSGQVVQFEGTLIYAFYGGVSYEVNARKTHEAVPLTDLQATANAAATHMDISQPASLKPEKQALVSVARPLVDSGDLHPAKVADWVKTGAAAIEGATGSSIGELIGEGLGFLGALL